MPRDVVHPPAHRAERGRTEEPAGRRQPERDDEGGREQRRAGARPSRGSARSRAGFGGRLPGGRHFSVLRTATAGAGQADLGEQPVEQLPARPTNGTPVSSSCAPGASPTSSSRAPGGRAADHDGAAGRRPAPGRRCSRGRRAARRPSRARPRPRRPDGERGGVRRTGGGVTRSGRPSAVARRQQGAQVQRDQRRRARAAPCGRRPRRRRAARSGTASAIASLWSSGVMQVLAADEHQRLDAAQDAERRELVVGGERVVELGDHVDRGVRGHPLDELHQRRADVAGCRTPPWRASTNARSVPSRRPRSKAAGRRAHAAGQVRQRPAGSPGRPPREARSVTSASRPVEVDSSATPTTRGAEQLGRASASAMIVMPPIEWPTSTTGPLGTTASRTASQVAAELVDGGVLGRAAAAAAVRALVVEDEPAGVVGGQRLALVVPDGHLLGVAVDEDDGQRGVAPARPPRRAAARRRRRAPRGCGRRAAGRTARARPGRGAAGCGRRPSARRRADARRRPRRRRRARRPARRCAARPHAAPRRRCAAPGRRPG